MNTHECEGHSRSRARPCWTGSADKKNETLHHNNWDDVMCSLCNLMMASTSRQRYRQGRLRPQTNGTVNKNFPALAKILEKMNEDWNS